ncbi:MAG: flagellar motor switch protein FliG [Hyphomicrobiales bacterium]|nr:flagellar motor switch protein FliG [Hyphomicrobiales bacterium]
MTGILETADGVRILSGPEKVAALLLSVERPLAEQILRRFETDEVREVARSAAELGRLSMAMLEDLVSDFASHFSTGKEISGSAGEAVDLISGVLPPEQVAEIVSDLLGSSNESVWSRLETVGDMELSTFMIGEHPQTAAIILNRLTPGKAGRVMGGMPAEFRKRVVHRMLGIKPVSPLCMRILEGGIQEDLLVQKRTAIAVDPSIRFADMLNKMDRNEMDDMLLTISEARPELAEAIRGRLFSFEDVITLSAAARAVIFDKVPTDKLIDALRGLNEEFVNVVLTSLAARARRMVEGELKAGGKVNPKEVAAARRIIADMVLDLAEKGQIELREAPAEAAE